MAKQTEWPPRNATGATGNDGPVKNPLDFITEDHMRERKVCAFIDRLAATLPVGPEERNMMVAFLNEQLPQHLADEEIDLFPLMRKRCEPEEEIDKVIDKLESDHGHALADAPAIAALIEAIQTDVIEFSASVCAQMAEFAYHARRHLNLENAIILPIARTRLTQADLETMKLHMLERRGLDRVSEGSTC
jgi:hemerythrin-like domain-containing protein